MTKEELAALYAEQKARELAEMIEEAYLRGYEQGRLDACAPITIDGIEFIDMGLPSGTLWSKTSYNYLHYDYKQRLLSYHEALNMPIPSLDQWQEGLDYCQFSYCYIIGPSGGRIGYEWAPSGYIPSNLGEECKENQNMFWLRGEVDLDNTAPTMIFDVKRKDESEFKFWFYKGTSRHFTGYKLPVFLVKNKE